MPSETRAPVAIDRRYLVTRENDARDSINTNLLIDLLDELVLVSLTQKTFDDITFGVWSELDTLGVCWVHGTIVRLGGNNSNVRLRLPIGEES